MTTARATFDASVWLATAAFMVIGVAALTALPALSGALLAAVILAAALTQAGLVTFVVLRRRVSTEATA